MKSEEWLVLTSALQGEGESLAGLLIFISCFICSKARKAVDFMVGFYPIGKSQPIA
jgi:hypothetical protein